MSPRLWKPLLGWLALILVLSTASSSRAGGKEDLSCLACHGNEGINKQKAGQTVSLYVNQAVLAGSVHRNLRCLDCHGDMGDIPHAGKWSPPDDPANCASCHGAALVAYRQSAHGQASLRGNQEAATCASCHGGHNVIKASGRQASRQMVESCLGCHEEIRTAYNYSFHGTALRLGYDPAAYCVDCHGSHDLLGPADPSSSVNPARLPLTCAKCHGEARENFARGKEHVTPRDRDKAFPLWAVWKFFVAMILFDNLKDGSAVLLELWRKLQRLGRGSHRKEGQQ